MPRAVCKGMPDSVGNLVLFAKWCYIGAYMRNPSVVLEVYGGSLDGQMVRVETSAECVRVGGEVYRIARDEDGSHFLRYVGVEPVAA